MKNQVEVNSDSEEHVAFIELTTLTTKSAVENGSQGKQVADESFLETITSCRWVLSYFGCICLTLSNALKVNLGLAMVCMVRQLNTSNITQLTQEDSKCAFNESTTIELEERGGDIEWDKPLQGAVLSSLFYGYMLTQIPGGYLAGRFGGKLVILVGMFVHGVATMLLPAAARFNGVDYVTSAYLVIFLRVLMGLSSAVIFPGMFALWGKWAPPLERSKLLVLAGSGVMLGTMLMLAVGGFFCEWRSFAGGWPSMFYVGGGVCLLFCPLWYFIVYNSPAEHPRISAREKEYILSSLEDQSKDNSSVAVPWQSIFTSPAMWAIIVAHTCSNFSAYTLMTKLPAFMSEVLQFNIKQNGLFSALPYLSMLVFANLIAQVIDRLRQRNVVSTVVCRKVSQCIAFVVPASIMVGIGFLSCEMRIAGVILIILAMTFQGFERSAWAVNHVDIAPRYAGVLMGITNTAATIPGIVAPSLVNMMTPTGSVIEWRNVFYVWAGINLFGALIYTVFAKGSVQHWAKNSSREAENSKENNELI